MGREGRRKVKLQQCDAHMGDPAPRAFQACHKTERACYADAGMLEENSICHSDGEDKRGGAEDAIQSFSRHIP